MTRLVRTPILLPIVLLLLIGGALAGQTTLCWGPTRITVLTDPSGLLLSHELGGGWALSEYVTGAERGLTFTGPGGMLAGALTRLEQSPDPTDRGTTPGAALLAAAAPGPTSGPTDLDKLRDMFELVFELVESMPASVRLRVLFATSAIGDEQIEKLFADSPADAASAAGWLRLWAEHGPAYRSAAEWVAARIEQLAQ